MDAGLWVALGIVAVIVIGVVVWFLVMNRRTARLRQQFGPEYDRAMDEMHDRRQVESELEARRERREELDIRPLDPAARKRYTARWTDVQARFVDDPADALKQAHGLVIQVMRDRGYPTDDFEQRAADVSVDHPQVVESYRAAYAISTRAASGDATTDEIRNGVVHYRALFADLLEEGDGRDLRQAR
jgi:uncharacterized iron-regulated membrane protein